MIFLGTGTSQGVPVIGCGCRVCRSLDSRDLRLRTSAVLKIGGKTIVFDVGPDFRQQMLREEICQIDAVLFTHEHNDHVIGLDDIRPYNFMKRGGIDVFGTKRVLNEVEKRFPYVFDPNPYPGAPSVNSHIINEVDSFNINGLDINIKPLPVSHGGWPVLGFRIGPVVYITDAKIIGDEVIEAASGCEVLVLNALRKKEHYSHLSLSDAIRLSEKIRPKRTFLTHISHTMGLYEDVSKELPLGVHLAYDGLKVNNSEKIVLQ
ncbi:MAG: MBL fold metallo-hydrolase [Saprospirales bacterium]|nr:MAG: MBL fold metallo-hydrolase [Saprospirales bacterium]